MKAETKMSIRRAGKLLNVTVANTPATLKKIHDAIARRAYEIYAARVDAPGDEKLDWQIAENQVLVPLCCGVLRLEHGVLIEADISTLGCKEINVCLEPRRLVIVGTSPADGNGLKVLTFRALNLPIAVDPSSATLKQRGPILEIELHEPNLTKQAKCFQAAA